MIYPIAHGRDAEDQDKRAPLFEVAADLLRHNIALGKLQPGLVLQESALSERMNMSRATVKRALEMIEAEGHICRFSGRGFLVAGNGSTPKREDLRQIELDLTGLDESVGKPNWLRIYDDVAYHVTRCPVFGRYRIIEVLMADEYSVSRTIIRDVLGRLQERGLIQKSRTSRWVVEPLTSQKIKDKYELRSILEVAALRSAKLPVQDLRQLADEIKAQSANLVLTPTQWFSLEQRFFEMVILTTPNEDLANYASSNRLALEACQSALFSLGLPPDTQSILELGQVIELSLSGSISAAASMLSMHLEKARDRTIAQLKITAIIDPPEDFPSYLQFV
ncbi:DNA-binding transcriptional repressor MngR [Thalassovita gelatinovora]|uniref:DNA-binding transcriptional repressor MngR n=1 Tax=Thalassovita gelatinovora TaxID=53501 RepID=A0A0P1G754_THAGE|nr:GntR family transcriptional regulator [Thalassovita gelatinovora]QIZ82018.1 GntR family transcriptional regulator [Thalassovita gelatinovora]CUH67486.1 DNA-binding transcriptional repressor MngR [Thalassovita gelatinovora]SEP73128.1 DNA-binding transcriptional regulator, GntR family [Thalassovita gelatinovora]